MEAPLDKVLQELVKCGMEWYLTVKPSSSPPVEDKLQEA